MSKRLKIFVLLPRVPYPLEKGDKVRAFHQLRVLSERHDIHLCCLNDAPLHPDAVRKLEAFCKSLNIFNISKTSILLNLTKALFNGKPLQVGYFFSFSAQRKVKELIAGIRPDHIYCQLLRTAEYVRHENVKKTLDYQDVFSAGIKRRIPLSPFWNKWWLRIEYKRLLSYEKEVFSDFNNKIIISGPDRDLIPHPLKDQIHVIPNGVDYDYFKAVNGSKDYDLLFTGNMKYPPNVATAVFLVKKIMPLVHRVNPAIRLLIAGATPDPSVISLAGEKIRIAGSVPDMRECYANAKLFIAPMQIGTGLQNKLLEAMAMKLPCITSLLANNALGATAGRDIFVCETAEEYAAKILELIEHPEQAAIIAANGYAYVREKFNWDQVTGQLEEIIINT